MAAKRKAGSGATPCRARKWSFATGGMLREGDTIRLHRGQGVKWLRGHSHIIMDAMIAKDGDAPSAKLQHEKR
jgi:hypothetical protein